MGNTELIIAVIGLVVSFVLFYFLILFMRWILKLDVIAANSIAQTRLLILIANERNVSATNLNWAAGEVEPEVVRELIAKAAKQATNSSNLKNTQ